MDTKAILRRGMWNSALLAVMFASTTAQALLSGSVLFAIVGALAVYFTAKDAITLHEASK